jgi:acyl-CoA thioesterase
LNGVFFNEFDMSFFSNFDSMSLPQISDALLRANGAMMNQIGFQSLESYEREQQRLRVAFMVRPEFCHSGGRIAQGGFVTAWLDAAMAHVVLLDSRGMENIASLEIKVSFIAAVPPGPVLAESHIVKKGKRIAFLESNLFDLKGKLLATATQTAMLIAMPNVEK